MTSQPSGYGPMWDGMGWDGMPSKPDQSCCHGVSRQSSKTKVGKVKKDSSKYGMQTS